jgi:hypothetical protein
MGSSFGRKVGTSTGRPISALAHLDNARFKVGGVTIDWSTVTAVSGSDVTLADGTIVKIGDKYLEFGQILNQIGGTTGEIQTIDLSGGDDPTAGTWTITVPANNAGPSSTTTALAWNAAAEVVETALEALANVGAGNVTVGKSGFVYTLTFSAHLGNVSAVTVGSGSLTGATQVDVATSTAGTTAGGKYGPAATSVGGASPATDGRQTTTRDRSFILPQTVLESEIGSDHPAGVCYAGTFFRERVKVGATGQPTLSDFQTAFPGVHFVTD